ncbi:isochorismatase family cysteine hydrolase [Bradyrhizobium japonicum]|uniref:isochorismatase family cysteine hydrolase n=1 Tax=Bradyrhizobium japonicum TaxID=375 RepID=UPI000456D422|nr:isochorismatase family cysteine hydrolase [Bradyrhizobium japonicum]AHY51835.1 isochorismatase hydrolase [Bradyrhizobium japonicum SEMIA 5079]MCD9105773.1 cysteine hydrolase [Bradyrhizobium japonicum]MCD9253332.1 cysteine hydrolase [Bradyrhizobium japonicum SEMIA 5079]MCD9818418.1 cysteine hydrolase [Bradyrhizobium japonicum]MCD9891399.1 cysteine hydrolase [Bradyrhizobium japonicum]
MHQAGILDEVRERVTRRRGGVAVFDRIEPRRTAHIVVDLQNGFMAPGQVLETPMARTIVGNVNRISAVLRPAGGIVVYTQHTADAEAVRTWSVYFDNFCADRARMIEAFTPGNPGHDLWPELDVAKQDLLVIKRRFGAFVPGSSNLHALLQERGIDTLIISGTLSQVCCEATARDAMMMNYKVFFITDANATLTDAEHSGTLSAMAHAFCDVRATQSMLDLIAAA